MTQFAAWFDRMKNPWSIAFYCALVALSYVFVDRSLALYLHAQNFSAILWLLKGITALGEWKYYAPIFFLLALSARFFAKNSRYEQSFWYLLICISATALFNMLLKICFGRARPELLFESQIFGFYGLQLKNTYWSFPSGHSITAASLASGLSVLIPRYLPLFFLVAVFICLTRLILGRHYLSDVLFGFYLGVLAVGFLTFYFRRRKWLPAAI